MKTKNNSQIHAGLDNMEIRNFISIQFIKLFEQRRTLKIPEANYDYYKLNYAQIGIMEANRTIAYNLKLKEIYENELSLINILKQIGYERFDVSDITKKDLVEYSVMMEFIGTKKEYGQFIKYLK